MSKRPLGLLSLCVALAGAFVTAAWAQPKKPPTAIKTEKPAAAPAADAQAEAARRAEVVATFEGGAITVGDLEDSVAAQSPFMRERYREPAERRTLLDKTVRFELLALEAERRGYGKQDAVAYSVKQNAVQTMLKAEFDDKQPPASVPDADVKAYYEAHLSEFVRPELRRASQLILGTELEAKALLPQAREADMRAFRELSRTKSRDDETKLRGGDLRYFDASGKLAEETGASVDAAIAKAAFALAEIGDTSGTVKTDRGYAIVKLTGKRPAQEEKLAQADERIRMRLWRERRETGIDALLSQLRAQHKPEVHPELIDAIKFEATAPLPPTTSLPPGFPRQRPEGPR